MREQTTGLLGIDKHKYGDPKVLPMKYTHFDDITPNNRIEFAMFYFVAGRIMQKLETAICKTNGGQLNDRQTGLLQHLQHKLTQMAARHKTTS